MKESELIEKMKERGFEVKCIDNAKVLWITSAPDVIARVEKEKMFEIDTNYEAFRALPVECRKAVFDDLVEYASTPTGEREEKKRYKYRLKRLVNGGVLSCIANTYLNYSTFARFFFLDNDKETGETKTIFAEDDPELELVNLDMFDKIEVR